jgi:D-apionolactonase
MTTTVIAPASLIELFGTEEPQPARRTLRAGPLSAVLEDSNLRDVRFGGVEVLRAINYLARDTSWGTYASSMSRLEVVENADRFAVTYSASCAGPEGRLDYRMKISGSADGTLTLQAESVAVTDFPTNRVGFVLLHPAELAGRALRIDHCDGTVTDRSFPELIDPNPPALNITAMTHHPVPGLTAHVAMAGDAFEMEDQRNWADASFKTFVRPLSRPRPYVIPMGTSDTQSIRLRITGTPPVREVGKRGTQAIVLRQALGTMPRIALFCDRDAAYAGDASVLMGAANLLIPRWQADAPSDLAKAKFLASLISAKIAVEAILAARHPLAEARTLLAALNEAGLAGATLLIAPQREFCTSPSGTLPPGEVTTDTLVQALRAAGHKGRIGAGTPSYFPEFNRNPPGAVADFIYFGGAATIHASDDASVVETIGVTDALLASARHLAGDRPIWFGPCTLAMRHTPYGAGLAANPNRIRMPVTGDDPRHFALFGAAYAVGIAAQSAGRIDCLTLAAPFGPFGLVNSATVQTPLAAIQRVLSDAAGAAAIAVTASRGVAALAWKSAKGTEVLAASLCPMNQEIVLPPAARAVRVLAASGQWQYLVTDEEQLELPAYRTLHFDLPAG